MSWLLLVLLSVFFTRSHRTPECVCIKDPHPSVEKIKSDRKQVFDRATAVFEGVVVASDDYRVTLRLRKRWKGTEDEVILRTGAVRGYDGSALPEECGYQFKQGEAYLVYAYGEREEMKASYCSTLQLKDAAEEEQGLDEIMIHETIKEDLETTTGRTGVSCRSPLVGSLANTRCSIRKCSL